VIREKVISMDWLLHKYIGFVSVRLDKFKRKGPSLYNFRCPLCGDSESSKSKARGYIFEKQAKMLFHCHNCGASSSVPNFIKMMDQNLYNEMQMEKLSSNKTTEQMDYEDFINKMKKPVFMKSGPLKGLKKVSQLMVNDPIKLFVTKREIPNPYHAKLFACPNFMAFVNGIIPNKFEKHAVEKHDEARLLIPFFDKDKNLHAFQGRALNKSSTKYITIILNEDVPKIYGLDTADLDKKTYVFEGPIDSMFVPNSIAIAGGDMISSLKGFDKKNLVVVYDNEPRSKETIKKLDKSILNGYNVCIWPDNLDHKDVNDMVLAGMSPEFIKHIIDTNTFRDLAAKMALTKWSKA
jgi:transcription elongation factor Elf1